jgi:hypothetical protein
VQVKSVRRLNYIFFPKENFEIRDNMLAAVVLFGQGETPDVYLLRSTLWNSPNELFADRKYEDKKSKPEWGLNLSQKNLPLLQQYAFDKINPTL